MLWCMYIGCCCVLYIERCGICILHGIVSVIGIYLVYIHNVLWYFYMVCCAICTCYDLVSVLDMLWHVYKVLAEFHM